MKTEGLAFLDTNILVYAFDQSDDRRREMAADLVRRLALENRLRLSTQVLQEFFVTVTRKIRRPIPASSAVELMDDFAVWPLFVIDYEAVREAGLLSFEQQLSFWGALILISARRSGAETVFSEDFNHGQTIHGVKIVNPFHGEKR